MGQSREEIESIIAKFYIPGQDEILLTILVRLAIDIRDELREIKEKIS